MFLSKHYILLVTLHHHRLLQWFPRSVLKNSTENIIKVDSVPQKSFFGLLLFENQMVLFQQTYPRYKILLSGEKHGQQ